MYPKTICVNLRVTAGGRPVASVIVFEITKLAILAEAGIQGSQGADAFGRGRPFGHCPDDISRASGHWIPAYAGMTVLSTRMPGSYSQMWLLDPVTQPCYAAWFGVDTGWSLA